MALEKRAFDIKQLVHGLAHSGLGRRLRSAGRPVRKAVKRLGRISGNLFGWHGNLAKLHQRIAVQKKAQRQLNGLFLDQADFGSPHFLQQARELENSYAWRHRDQAIHAANRRIATFKDRTTKAREKAKMGATIGGGLAAYVGLIAASVRADKRRKAAALRSAVQEELSRRDQSNGLPKRAGANLFEKRAFDVRQVVRTLKRSRPMKRLRYLAKDFGPQRHKQWQHFIGRTNSRNRQAGDIIADLVNPHSITGHLGLDARRLAIELGKGYNNLASHNVRRSGYALRRMQRAERIRAGVAASGVAGAAGTLGYIINKSRKERAQAAQHRAAHTDDGLAKEAGTLTVANQASRNFLRSHKDLARSFMNPKTQELAARRGFGRWAHEAAANRANLFGFRGVRGTITPGDKTVPGAFKRFGRLLKKHPTVAGTAMAGAGFGAAGYGMGHRQQA